MIRAVVFDIGGTLWFEAKRPDEARIYALAAQSVAPLVASWGIDVGEPLEAIEREVWENALEGYRLAEDSRSYKEPSLPALIREALRRRGIRITQAQAAEWWRAAYLPVREFNWQLFPDVIDVLSELKGLGIKLAVCTNRPFTSEMFAPDLQDYGLASYLDAVVCSGDTGYVKPHPSTFRLALDRLAVSPEVTAMVGDSCPADIAGAKALGMSTVLKLNGRYEAPPCVAADYSIHDLGELLDLPFLSPRIRPLVRTESLTPHEDANAERY